MKSRIRNFCWAAIICVAELLVHPAFLAAQTNTTSAKPKIGIMKFEVGEDVKPSLGTFLYESFSGEMVASGALTVVDWEQMDRLQKVVAQAQPNVSPEEARRMAMHQLGIEKLYLGTLTKVGSKFYETVKLLKLDLTVERSERLPAASEDDLEPTVVKLARLLAANPEQAKAIKVELDRQKAETDRWSEAQKTATEESLTAFLKEFPDGTLAVTARKALEEMRTNRLAWEAAERDKKQAAEVVVKQQAGALEDERRGNIAGTWQLIYVGWKKTWTANISQQGQNVTISYRIPSLLGSTPVVYKGTLIQGHLKVRATGLANGTLVGEVSEDGNLISGTCKALLVKSTEFELTRIGPASNAR